MIEITDVVVLRGKTPKGEAYVAEHGDRWFVREIDRSTLGRNLGLLVCPESVPVTPPRPDPRMEGWTIGVGWNQADGESRWVHPRNDADLEVVEIDS